ncbi:hypothetical protein [Streptomyces sp. NPDC058371]|uniref:hypothetical protein n=1 Tax=Streptomyces sp. NPDC058371 TaxID=3346463 RepID=UPI00364AD57A
MTVSPADGHAVAVSPADGHAVTVSPADGHAVAGGARMASAAVATPDAASS